MRGRWVVLMMLAWLGATVVPSAQFRGLGRVTGTVTDESGSPLRDVSIHATLAGKDGIYVVGGSGITALKMNQPRTGGRA